MKKLLPSMVCLCVTLLMLSPNPDAPYMPTKASPRLPVLS